MKIELKNMWNGAVLFSIETENLRLAVEAAVNAGANLRLADLQDADLRIANLQGVDLRSADLRRANLRGANLKDADLQGVDLRGADLRGVDLWGADLRIANLRGVDLRGADLHGVDLRGADLHGADLHGADLQDADLQDADLRIVDLRGADLQDAKNLKCFPIQILGHRHFLQTMQDGRLAIGCEIHTFKEWLRDGFAEKLGSENDYSETDVELYKLHITHMQTVSRLLWKKTAKAEA